MFEWLSNFGDWLQSIFNPLITFFQSFIHGFKVLFSSFPTIIRLVTSSVGYLPSLFAAFVGITLIILIVYIIVGRNAGGD